MKKLVLVLLLVGCSAAHITLEEPDAGPPDAGPPMCPVVAADVLTNYVACEAFVLVGAASRGADALEICAGRVCPWANSNSSPMATPCPRVCSNRADIGRCLSQAALSNDCRNFDLALAGCPECLR